MLSLLAGTTELEFENRKVRPYFTWAFGGIGGLLPICESTLHFGIKAILIVAFLPAYLAGVRFIVKANSPPKRLPISRP